MAVTTTTFDSLLSGLSSEATNSVEIIMRNTSTGVSKKMSFATFAALLYAWITSNKASDLASVLGAYVSSMSASPEITVATVDALDSYRGPVRAKITGTGPDGTTGSWWHVLLIGAKDAQVCQFLWRNVTPITIYLRIRGYSSGSYSTSSDWKSLSFS